jgi:hypothetical protein
MLPPEMIDRLKREREEDDRPSLQIPLYVPEIMEDIPRRDEEELTSSSHVIVIDLM